MPRHGDPKGKPSSRLYSRINTNVDEADQETNQPTPPQNTNHAGSLSIGIDLTPSETQQTAGYVRHIISDENHHSFAAFRFTRDSALNEIKENLSDRYVQTLLQFVIKEQLKQPHFIEYLIREGENTAATQDPNANSQLSIQNKYLIYDLQEKNISSGWPQPAILQILAYLTQTELHIWQLERDGAINEYQQKEYPPYMPVSLSARIDLLLLDNNRCEKLEIIGNLTPPIYAARNQPITQATGRAASANNITHTNNATRLTELRPATRAQSSNGKPRSVRFGSNTASSPTRSFYSIANHALRSQSRHQTNLTVEIPSSTPIGSYASPSNELNNPIDALIDIIHNKIAINDAKLQEIKDQILPYMLAQPVLSTTNTNEVAEIYDKIQKLKEIDPLAALTYLAQIRPAYYEDREKNRRYEDRNYHSLVVKLVQKISLSAINSASSSIDSLNGTTQKSPSLQGTFDTQLTQALAFQSRESSTASINSHISYTEIDEKDSTEFDLEILASFKESAQPEDSESIAINATDPEDQQLDSTGETLIALVFTDFLNKINPVQGIEYSLVLFSFLTASASAMTSYFFAAALVSGMGFTNNDEVSDTMDILTIFTKHALFLTIGTFALLAQEFFSWNNGIDKLISGYRNIYKENFTLSNMVFLSLAFALVVPSIFSTAVIGEDGLTPPKKTTENDYQGLFRITLENPWLAIALSSRVASALFTNLNFFMFRLEIWAKYIKTLWNKNKTSTEEQHAVTTLLNEVIEFSTYLSYRDPNTFMQLIGSSDKNNISPSSSLPLIIHNLQNNTSTRNLTTYRRIIESYLQLHADLKQAYQHTKHEREMADLDKSNILKITSQLRYIEKHDDNRYASLLKDYPLLAELINNPYKKDDYKPLLHRVHMDILQIIIRPLVDEAVHTVCLNNKLTNPSDNFAAYHESLPRRVLRGTADFIFEHPWALAIPLAICATGQNWKAGSLVPGRIFNQYDLTPHDAEPADMMDYFEKMAAPMTSAMRKIYAEITVTSWLSYLNNVIIHYSGIVNAIDKGRMIRKNGWLAEFYNSRAMLICILVPSACYGLSQGGSSMAFPFIKRTWVRLLNIFCVSPTIFTMGIMSYDGAARAGISRAYLSTLEEAFAHENFYRYFQSRRKAPETSFLKHAWNSTVKRTIQSNIIKTSDNVVESKQHIVSQTIPENDPIANLNWANAISANNHEEKTNLVTVTPPSEEKTETNNNAQERTNLVRLTFARITTLADVIINHVNKIDPSEMSTYNLCTLTSELSNRVTDAVKNPYLQESKTISTVTQGRQRAASISESKKGLQYLSTQSPTIGLFGTTARTLPHVPAAYIGLTEVDAAAINQTTPGPQTPAPLHTENNPHRRLGRALNFNAL